jgi:AraC-like DNA-binding protein
MNSEPSFCSFPEILMIQEETRPYRSYFWDNSERGDFKGIVIQQTLKGSVAFWDAAGRKEAGAGQAILFRHGENTRYGLDDACQLPYEQVWMMISETPATLALYNDLITSFGAVLRMETKGEAGQLLARSLEARKRGVVRDRFSDAETVIALLMGLYREQITDRRGRDPVAFGRHLLATQFRSPRNLKQWADEIGWSREHFSREFAARYREPPAAFLRRLRLEHARRLLINPGLTVDEVGAASGFASPKTFHRAFREYFGHPPGKARTV